VELVNFLLKFHYAFAIVKSLQRNTKRKEQIMKAIYEYRVLFDNAEMLVTARDSEEAQDRAIEEMEDAGQIHGSVVRIIRTQQV